jgi:hypothetical protein
VRTGRSLAVWRDITPPLLCTTSSSAGKALGTQIAFEPAQVAAHHGLQRGVERGGRAAFELADLGQHFAGRGHVRVGPQLAHRRHGQALVLGVGVGVDEEHAHRLAARFEQRARLGAHLLQVDRRVQRAVGQHALVHLAAQLARHHGLEAAAQAPGLGPVAAAHLQHVAKAARGDDAGARHLALQQRVGAHGGAVHDGRDVRGRIGHARHAVHEAACLLAARGRHLDDARGAVGFVEHEEVGEGAADIDADDKGFTRGSHSDAFVLLSVLT